MQDLRSDISAAFDREQKAHPMTSDMRQRVTLTAIAPRRPQTNFQWVAVAAAALIGTTLIVALMSSHVARNVGQVQPQASPFATPSAPPAFVEDYGTPPSGVPLVYLQDPKNPLWYIGFDWTGNPRGTIKLAQAPQAGLDQAPDGSSFEIGSPGKGGTGQFLDRLGSPLPQAVAAQTISARWADDSQHLCGIALDQQKFTWTLVTFGPNQPARNVRLIAQDSGLGQTGIDVAACSFKNNRAIAVRTAVAWPSEIWSIRLSDGMVIAHVVLQPTPALAGLVASPDAALLAENAGNGPPNTVIRRFPDSSTAPPVATLDRSMSVLEFSADNTMALVTTSTNIAGQPSHLGVVDVATGRLVWRYDGPEEYAGEITEPTGAAFAIRLKSPTTSYGIVPINVVIVDGTGNEVAIPGSFNYVRP